MAQPTHTKVMSRKPHRSHTKDFLKLLQEITSREGWREEQALTHWLTAASCAVRRPFLDFQPKVLEKNEAAYMHVVRSCRHPNETMRDMTEQLAIIIQALDVEESDVLTPIFSEVSASSNLGQFFTPWELSLVMARMMLQDAPEILQKCRDEGRNYITCEEPACGVGGMIMAANIVFKEHGINPATDVHWVAKDVDLRAVNGAFLQVSLSGASATIVHGNTISLEVWDVMHTVASILHPKRIRLNEGQARVAEPVVEPETAPIAPTAAPTMPAKQLGFDFTF